MRRLTHLIVLVAFVFSCGGQSAVLGIAWANMIREYSQMVPLAQAVEMTFSGQYPCPICKAIAEKKSSEQQKALTLEKYEKKFPIPVVVTVASPKVTTFQYEDCLVRFHSRTETPPAPPPRLAWAKRSLFRSFPMSGCLQFNPRGRASRCAAPPLHEDFR